MIGPRKIGLEVDPGPLGIQAFVPVSNGICKDTGVFEHEYGFAYSSAFGDGVMTSSSKMAAFLGIFPNHFNGIGWVPLTIEAHVVGFELIGADVVEVD